MPDADCEAAEDSEERDDDGLRLRCAGGLVVDADCELVVVK
jgi:hypothetical protein